MSDVHYGTYAVYKDGRRISTHFIWDVNEFPAAWHKKYFRWTRAGWRKWKKETGGK